MTTKTNNEWEKMKEDLREKFEELFPKDQEARDGIRPSKSNRTSALVLWAEWEMILREVLFSERQMLREEIEEYPHRCGACEEEISSLSHTMLCGFRKHLLKLLEE